MICKFIPAIIPTTVPTTVPVCLSCNYSHNGTHKHYRDYSHCNPPPPQSFPQIVIAHLRKTFSNSHLFPSNPTINHTTIYTISSTINQSIPLLIPEWFLLSAPQPLLRLFPRSVPQSFIPIMVPENIPQQFPPQFVAVPHPFQNGDR